MSVFGSVRLGVIGAMMLARGQSAGVLLISAGPGSIARSFWAMALSLPLVLYLYALDWRDGATPSDPALAMLRQALVFAVAWLSFMVASHAIAVRLHRRTQWRQMIVVWAWCQVPMNMLAMLSAMPAADGAPEIVSLGFAAIAQAWALWVEWFAFRLTFATGRMAAVWLVLFDWSIGILVMVADRLLTGE